jgi:hypothetical protein
VSNGERYHLVLTVYADELDLEAFGSAVVVEIDGATERNSRLLRWNGMRFVPAAMEPDEDRIGR